MKNYTVRLVTRMKDGSFQFNCTGVVTGPQQILTAAHCLGPEAGNASIMTNNLYVEIRDLRIPNGLRRVAINGGRRLMTSSYDLASLDIVYYQFPADHIAPLAIAGCDEMDTSREPAGAVPSWNILQSCNFSGALSTAKTAV